MADDPVMYRTLFRPRWWEAACATITFSTNHPPDRLVNSVRIVAFVGERILVCRQAGSGMWFLPGGTREPGESVEETASRELAEETGARPRGAFHWLGAHRGVSGHPAPMRPHLAHPEFAWLWGFADVLIDGRPSNPPGDEQIVDVQAATAAEARRLLIHDADLLPDLIDLAVAHHDTSG